MGLGPRSKDSEPSAGEMRLADDAGVEGVAGEGEAGGAEDFPAAARADAEEREVAGASAEVADEDGFRVCPRVAW